MNPPKLSLLVPVYNTRQDWLRIALSGLANQSYPNLDVIVGDDGSTKASTIRVMKETIEKWPDRIRTVRSSENKGTANALTVALNAVDDDTKYVSVAASDDLFHPDWQANRIRLFETLPPQIALVYDNYLMLSYFAFDPVRWQPVRDQNGQLIRKPNIIPILLRPYDYRLLCESNYIPGVSIWRYSVYEKIPKTFFFEGYDERAYRHCEDYAHWLAITDYWDAFWFDQDPARTWTYRFTIDSKYNVDRRGAQKAKEFLQYKAKERRGLL